MLDALEGKLEEALQGWKAALELDGNLLLARLNRGLVEAEISLSQAQEDPGELRLAPAPAPTVAGPPQVGIRPGVPRSDPGLAYASPPIRIAILSFLFNWPSTGGGNMHTAGLVEFLSRAGYEVRHYYARYPAWGIGRVAER